MPLAVANPLAMAKEGGTINQAMDLPPRTLCGPGPGNAHPRVHAAMARPQIGHMDPAFMTVMEDIKVLLRYVWQTNNQLTVPMSGTGSAAWEAVMANLIEPGDALLVFNNGYFGDRCVDMAGRYQAKVTEEKIAHGTVFTLDQLKAGLAAHKPALVWVCHAETSTGVCQPLEGWGEACSAAGALLIVDTVTSIAGVPLYLDAWKVDACYAGGQKCLSCPPGIAPVTFSPKAVAKMDARAARGAKVPNWYLDLDMIRKYMEAGAGGARTYHHTAPISMAYALREALTLVAEEGLETRWVRHRETAEYFWGLLEEQGLECLVAKEHRLPSLTTVKIPEGVDGMKVIVYCREKFNLEIGGALGELKGKVWRVGLMGFNSERSVALFVASALKEAIAAGRVKL